MSHGLVQIIVCFMSRFSSFTETLVNASQFIQVNLNSKTKITSFYKRLCYVPYLIISASKSMLHLPKQFLQYLG